MKIAYEKYENMNRRQFLNALTSAEKKLDKLQERFKTETANQAELIKFIKAKLKASLDKPRLYTLETAPTLKKNEKMGARKSARS